MFRSRYGTVHKSLLRTLLSVEMRPDCRQAHARQQIVETRRPHDERRFQATERRSIDRASVITVLNQQMFWQHCSVHREEDVMKSDKSLRRDVRPLASTINFAHKHPFMPKSKGLGGGRWQSVTICVHFPRTACTAMSHARRGRRDRRSASRDFAGVAAEHTLAVPQTSNRSDGFPQMARRQHQGCKRFRHV